MIESNKLMWGWKLLVSAFTPKGEEVVELYIRKQLRWITINEWDIYTIRWDSIFYEELASAWTQTIFDKSDLIYDDDGTDKKSKKNKDILEMHVHDALPTMRKNFVKYVVENTRPEWVEDVESRRDLIDKSDIDDFYGRVTKTKMWSDHIINKNSSIIAAYHNLCSVDWYDVHDWFIEVEVEEAFDFNDENLPFLKEFEELEKAAWKNHTPRKYWKYIDAMDLTALKRNLKDSLWNPFIPKWRQSEVLLFMGRFNYFVTCRWGWKTFVISYLIRRQLFLPNQLIGVLLPDKNNYARPLFRFIKPSIKWVKWFKASMAWSNISIKNELLDSEVIFFPGNKDPDSSRGNTLDMLIIEEADFVIGKAAEAAKPSISRWNMGNLFAITTVGAEKRSWFYQDLISAEMQMRMGNKEYYAKRVTIHQNPFILPEERHRLLTIERAKNPEQFDREWMCSFSTEDSIDAGNFWVIDEDPYTIAHPDGFEFHFANEVWSVWIEFFSRYLLAYDIGKQLHKPWIVLLWEHSDWSVHVVCAQYLAGWYYKQAEYLKFLSDFITKKWRNPNLGICIDYLWVWVAVSEVLENFVGLNHIKMENWWSSYAKDQMVEGRFKFNKSRFLNKLKWWMVSGIIKGRSFQIDLMGEIELYNGDDEATAKTNSGTLHHFDILNALIMWAWFSAIQWFFRKIEKSVIRQASEMMYGNEDWMLPNSIEYYVQEEEEYVDWYDNSYIARR